MASANMKEDLRTQKTERALFQAIYSLLEKRNFNRITVKDICEEALVSRATFYAHFIDKYDLLKSWFDTIKPGWCDKDGFETRDALEASANAFLTGNEPVIRNIVDSANYETLEIIYEFALKSFRISNRSPDDRMSQRSIAMSTFFSGGLINYLYWHVRNKMPLDIANTHVIDIIETFRSMYDEA